MKHLRSILAALALTGCTCTAPRTGDVGIDRSAPDAGLDAPIPDAPFVLPDVPVRAPLCGPINATTCPIQSAATVSACASGEGAVFFDGAHCQETPSLACGSERGAFGSFEECAVVCAAMYCDASKIVFGGIGGEPPGCETPTYPGPACSGGRDAFAALATWTECEAFQTLNDCRPEGSTYHCFQTDTPVGDDRARVWEQFRRASLLPFVTRLECVIAGP
jgi:hypothetical protein